MNVFELTEWYKKQRTWLACSESTQKRYEKLFRTAFRFNDFGEQIAAEVDAEMVDELHQAIYEEISPHAANFTMAPLRVCWNQAMRFQHVFHNPFSHMGLKGVEARSAYWSEDFVNLFVECADWMGKDAIGTMILMCYDLCQRPIDVVEMTWDNYKRGVDPETKEKFYYFDFVQQKTGARLYIPISERLHTRLHKPDQSWNGPIITNPNTGEKFTDTSYLRHFKSVRDECGIPSDLWISDLRRTGLTDLSNQGATEDELRAISGHTSRQVLNVYVQPTLKKARKAINKRFYINDPSPIRPVLRPGSPIITVEQTGPVDNPES